MEFHPFANVWPLMEGQKFDELVADIKAHGLRQAIITYQQKILDGRNRYNACVTAGIQPRYEPANAKNDDEALALSASLNKHRRHMNEDALAFIAEEMANIEQGIKAGKIDQDISSEKSSSQKQPITLEKAAKTVGIHVSRVLDARAIKKHAPELEKDVMENKLSMRAAAEKARAKAKPKSHKKTRAEVYAANAAKSANHTSRDLTRRDVDPEFIGDEIAFVTEYGHVWMRTSQERSTSRLTDWAIGMRHMARKLREQQLPKISPVVLSWLRKPKQADVESLQASLAELELAVATARDLLERAQSATATSNNGHDKSHSGREYGA